MNKYLLVFFAFLFFARNANTQPNLIPNLIIWNRADSVIHLTNEVSQWYDLSGSNNHSFQATTTRMPNLIPSISSLNNQPGLSFNGTSEFLSGLQIPGLETSSITIYVIASGLNQSGTEATLIGFNSSFASSFWMYQRDNSTLTSLMRGNRVGTTLGSLPYTGFNYSILNLNKLFGSSLKLKINDVELLSTTNATQIGDFVNGIFYIGSIGTARYFKGNISEILVYNRSLTETENDSIITYFQDRYTPSLSLGSDTTIYGFCPYLLNAGGGFTSYLWSDGTTGQTLNATESGQYWVQVTDIFGFTKSDTINISYPAIALPATQLFCPGESVVWDTGLGTDYSYLWSTGETSQGISVSASEDVWVEVTDTNSCFRRSDTLSFVLDTYPLTVSLGNDTNLCIGNSIQLVGGAAQTVSYLWPDLSTSSEYFVDTSGNYYVETTNLNGCIGRDTLYVTILGTAPTALFSFANSCFGDPTSFVDESAAAPSDAISTWSWDLGDGITLTDQSPQYTYLNPGTYSVDLYVETTGGCGDHEVQQITVFNLPTVGLSTIGHCSDESIQFNDLSTPGDGAVSSWLWNFGQPSSGLDNVSVMNNPTKLYSESGSFVVYFQVSDDNGCSDDTTFTIVVDQSPAAAFTAPDACENAVVGFSNTSSGGFTYLWNFGDLTTSILSNPVHTYSAYGPKTVLLDVTAANGCASSFQGQVYIHPIPIPDINVGPLCADTYVPLVDQSFLPEGNIAASMWVINSLDTVYGVSCGFQFDATGQQEILLLTTSAAGCSASTSQFVDPQVFLNADFDGGSGILAANENFTFVNLTDDPAISIWEFGDGSSSLITSPSHEYSNDWIDSTLTVSLIVSNALGCIDTVERVIQIRPSRLDLALTNLYLQNTNGFYSLGVQLKNDGSVTINSADLVVILPQGPALSETWNGMLQPGMSTIYVFNSQPNAFVSTENSTDDFICVDGLGHDDAGSVELDLSDNKICRNTEGEEVVLLPLYPNPASDAIIVQVLVSVSEELSLELTDSRGRLVKTILSTQIVAKGFYSYEVDLSTEEAGTYFIRLQSGEKEVLQKVMVIH